MDVFKNFPKAELRNIVIEGTGGVISPPPNTFWLLLSGVFQHITATSSSLFAYTNQGAGINLLVAKDAAVASGIYPIFELTGWVPTILDGTAKDRLEILGDTPVNVNIQVLEWTR